MLAVDAIPQFIKSELAIDVRASAVNGGVRLSRFDRKSFIPDSVFAEICERCGKNRAKRNNEFARVLMDACKVFAEDHVWQP